MTKLILGLDEVGRGPIAGPLVIGACVLSPRYFEDGCENPNEFWQSELTDSKALSEHRREILEPIIRENALAYGLGWVPAEELDAIGIPEGLCVAARRAVEDLERNFPKVKFSEIVIDGMINFLDGTKYAKKVTTVVKADLRIKEVSAASILAKVARDHYMIDIGYEQYPEYEFARHKGYGTELHWKKLRKYGPCPEHRWVISRISKHYGARPLKYTTLATENVPKKERYIPSKHHRPIASTKPKKNPTAIGNVAERKIMHFLINEKGHKILSHNFRRKNCEIDIVSATSEHIYFTEVKYRSNPNSGSPVEAITPKKLKQMKFASEIYMGELVDLLVCFPDELPSPVLAVGTLDKTGRLDWFELTSE